ncbi:MAG: hypothetical protein AAGH15_22760 [Myxococcota bacterium]
MTKTTMILAALLSLGFGVAQRSFAEPHVAGSTPSARSGQSADRAMPVCEGAEAVLTAAEGASFVSTIRPDVYPAAIDQVTFAAAGAGSTASFDCDPSAPFHVRVWKAREAFPSSTPADGGTEMTVVADADGMVRLALPNAMTLEQGEVLFVVVHTQQITLGAQTFGSCLEACPTARAELLESTQSAPYVWRSMDEPLAARLAVNTSAPAYAAR